MPSIQGGNYYGDIDRDINDYCGSNTCECSTKIQVDTTYNGVLNGTMNVIDCENSCSKIQIVIGGEKRLMMIAIIIQPQRTPTGVHELDWMCLLPVMNTQVLVVGTMVPYQERIYKTMSNVRTLT